MGDRENADGQAGSGCEGEDVNDRLLLPKLSAKRDKRMVHKLIRKTAKEMAGCFYEFAAHDNVFYRYYPNVGFFINREWPRFILIAKQTLVDCLKSGSLTERDKEDIVEALTLDATLPYSQQETQITNFRH